MPTGKQIRAARVLLDWDAVDLAARVGLRRETILSIENNLSHPRSSTVDKIIRVFSDNGVAFNGERGVELRDDTVRLLEGNESFLGLLDDIFLTLKNGDEALFSFVCNRLSSASVVEKQLLLRQKGVKFRFLIEEGDTYCHYPLDEYRSIPSARFHNNTQVIYGDKVAAMVTDRRKTAIIIHNRIFAKTQRSIFEMLWDAGGKPGRTTAEKIYD